jgi:hypothetical protein
MKNFILLLLMVVSTQIISQNLIIENLYPDQDQSWPSLFDVTIDGEGRIWTCSENGDVFYMENDEWVHIGNFGEDVTCWEIDFDTQGNTWVSTFSGLYKFDGSEWTSYNSQNSNMPVDRTGHMCIDQNDKLWCSTGGDGVITYDGTNFEHFTKDNSILENNSVDDIELDKNGNVWIADDEFLYKISGDNWTKYNTEDKLEWGVWVRAMFPGEGDEMYFCTWSGLFSYDGEWHSHTDISGYVELSGGIMDNLGNIWYCELFNGMYMWDGTELYFFEETPLDEEPQIPSQLFSITVNSVNKKLWTGNLGSTVVVVDDSEFTGSPLTIIEHPSSATKCEGDNISFSIEASGNNLSYVWYKDDVEIENSESSVLSIDLITESDAGSYYCAVSDDDETINSEPALLTVHTLVGISTQPEPVDLKVGETAQFPVDAIGSITSYQWYKDSEPLSDANNVSGSLTNTLTISNVSLDDEGMYKCEIVGSCNTEITDEVTLSINTGVYSIENMGIEISPNPTEDFLFIKSEKDIKINHVKLINNEGKIAKSIDKDYNTIDVSGLSKGLYLLIIIDDENTKYSKKVIIQ